MYKNNPATDIKLAAEKTISPTVSRQKQSHML